MFFEGLVKSFQSRFKLTEVLALGLAQVLARFVKAGPGPDPSEEA